MSTQALRNTTAAWRATDAQHHLHPFTDFGALAAEGGSRIITKAEGCCLEDSEGERILDGMAGLWCVNIGYGRNEMIEAIAEQARRLPYYSMFDDLVTPPAADLAAKLADLAPGDLNHVCLLYTSPSPRDS